MVSLLSFVPFDFVFIDNPAIYGSRTSLSIGNRIMPFDFVFIDNPAIYGSRTSLFIGNRIMPFDFVPAKPDL